MLPDQYYDYNYPLGITSFGLGYADIIAQKALSVKSG